MKFSAIRKFTFGSPQLPRGAGPNKDGCLFPGIFDGIGAFCSWIQASCKPGRYFLQLFEQAITESLELGALPVREDVTVAMLKKGDVIQLGPKTM